MRESTLDKECDRAFNVLDHGEIQHGFKVFARLARKHPDNAKIVYGYGCAALKLGERALAESVLDKARELARHNAGLLLHMGHQYANCRRPEKARTCFEQSITAEPRSINPRIALAELLEKAHDFNGARSLLDECLTMYPRDEQACYLSAVLDRHENKLERAEGRLRSLLSLPPKHEFVRYASRYELAKVLDRTGRYDEAMGVLADAKNLMRALIPNSEWLENEYQKCLAPSFRERAQPKNILNRWTRYFPKEKRNAIPPLAFLGGHPRSGTTLLEQILGVHPGVAAVDEPMTFYKAILPAFHNSSKFSVSRLNALRQRYVEGLREEVGATGQDQLLLDKNPSLTTYLSILLKLIPELRVIISLRDPRDVVLSCYFQNLTINCVSMHFLSLHQLARHYADLMNVWLAVRKWEGFSWIETRYENVVADLKGESRRVTEFLGMTWNKEQAHYHEINKRTRYYSPSYNDVTKPIYTRSINRWRAYEKHLAPIMAELDPFCRALGYV